MFRRTLALALLGLIVLAAPPSFAGDADMAKFLLKHGREALGKGKYENALAKLEKARLEDPTLIEATYWVAYAHEKSKQKRLAIREYRAFCRLARSRIAVGTLSKSDDRLLKKAHARLKSLDAVGIEIDKIQGEFAKRLFDVAKSNASSDPTLALRAVTMVQRAVPDHAGAKDLIEQLLDSGNPRPEAFERIGKWQNLIANCLFGRNDGWVYDGRNILIDVPGGRLFMPPGGFDSGPSYAFSADVRLDAVLSAQQTCKFGVIFGLTEKKGFIAVVLKDKGKEDRVALGSIQVTPVKDAPIKVVDCGEWKAGMTMRLGVVVEGTRIRIYLGDKMMIEHQVEGRENLAGDIAFSQQNLRARLSRFRIGTLEGAAK